LNSNRQSRQNAERWLPSAGDACSELARVINGRRDIPTGSYTNKLLEGGANSILKKIGRRALSS